MTTDDHGRTSYEGAAFLPGGTGRLSGTITVSPAGVAIESGDHSLLLPFEGLKIRTGGASDRLIFFEHPAHDGASIFTGDRAVLSDPIIRERPELTGELRGIQQAVIRRRTFLILTLAVISGLVLWLFASRDHLVSAVANRIPPSVEQRLGEVAMRQILVSSRTVSDPRVVAPMEAIIDRLGTALLDQPYELNLYVVDDESVNAFALPGGYLAVHTGLIREARSADEIAGVLAHEIAHVVERHSLRQLISTVGVFALVQAVLGDVSGIVAAAAEGGGNLLVLRFSRDAEREADQRGLEILVAAGVDPAGLLSFFDTLRTTEGAGAAVPAIVSTHPPTDERIERLREMVGAIDRRHLESIEIDLDDVKQAIETHQP